MTGAPEAQFFYKTPNRHRSKRTLIAKRRSDTRGGGIENTKRRTDGSSAVGCGVAVQYTSGEKKPGMERNPDFFVVYHLYEVVDTI